MITISLTMRIGTARAIQEGERIETAIGGRNGAQAPLHGRRRARQITLELRGIGGLAITTRVNRALSQGIAELERRLGVPLFAADGRRRVPQR